jgi:uroporphyrinogen decarboxylase
MTKLERFLRAVRGDRADRPPVSAWLHFGSEHLDAATVADLHVRFHRAYDWDFVKVMNDYRFPLPGIDEVADVDDLARFEPLSMDEAAFATQLEVLRRIRSACGPDVPIVETLFDPLQTLVRAAGGRTLELVRGAPEAGRRAVAAVSETLVRYVDACREVGVSGIFLSLNWAVEASAGGLSAADFALLAEPFERDVLAAAEGMTRIAHVHGFDLDAERVLAYPVDAFNWSHLHTSPSLGEARRLTDVALMGGFDELAVAHQTPREILAGARSAYAEAGAAGFLLAPGCSVPVDTPSRVLHAMRGTAEALA